MNPQHVSLTPIRKVRIRLACLVCLSGLLLAFVFAQQSVSVNAQFTAAPYRNFEGPQVHPLAITPDGTRLLAVNTPNNSLSIFHLTGRNLTLMAEIPVGLEPVSVAARTNSEVWVVNWLSDSVSVVDLRTWSVSRTFDVGDEPTDVVFTGSQNEMAFVCVSGLNEVRVFNALAPQALPQIVAIRGKQPRALARNGAGTRVFVSVFESGNQTTIVPASQVQAGGGLPPPVPAMSNLLPPAPAVGLIVKWNGSGWSDERGDTRWTQFIPYTLADVDVVAIDATATPSLAREVKGVGTHMGNAVVDGAGNRLLVLNDQAINDTRFEPNLRGRFLNTRLSSIDLNTWTVSSSDLNPHINFSNAAGSDLERSTSLALPADIVRAADGTMYVAAMGSGKVGVVDQSGNVQARIGVGGGPTGLALNQSRNLLYVLNRFDQTLSIVDLVTRAEIGTAPVGFNPEPANIARGRRFLYDATLSAHGNVSCASCHDHGHRDGLAWDLGDPQGAMQIVGFSQFHPMKGPMTTQSLRGITETEPLHWRGDRAALANFNPAFVSLLGGPRQLNPAEQADFSAFVASLAYPPNPNENLDRSVPNPVTGPSAFRGSQLFNTGRLDGGVLTCNQCHTTFPGFGTGTNRLIIPAAALQESQDFKVPQLRGLYQKTGLNQTAGEQLTGFGFIHDGSFDTLFSFLHAAVFTFQNDGQRRDLEQFLLAFDTGTAPAVGLQITVTATNKSAPETTNRLNLLMAQASAGNCDLIAKGYQNLAQRGYFFVGGGFFQPDRQNQAAVTLDALRQSVTTGGELTFTGVPAGSGRRLGIDRDGDNILDGDEPLQPNALDNPRFFVWQQYADFLSRDPDDGGYDYWTSQINSCSPGDQLCINAKRIAVSDAFFFEPEFQETAAYVYRVYRSAFGANPTFLQFGPDRQLVIGGADLDQSKTAFALNFVQRPAFLTSYPNSLSAQEFVTRMLTTVQQGSGVDLSSEAGALLQLFDGTNNGRAAILRRVADNLALIDAEYNKSFVLNEYFSYLRRDSETSGYNFWLGQVNRFPLRSVEIQHAMVCSFITSAEYQLRFGPSITHSNQECPQ